MIDKTILVGKIDKFNIRLHNIIIYYNILTNILNVTRLNFLILKLLLLSYLTLYLVLETNFLYNIDNILKYKFINIYGQK